MTQGIQSPGGRAAADTAAQTGFSPAAGAPEWATALLEEIAGHAMTVRGLLNEDDGTPFNMAAGHLVAMIGALADQGLHMARLGMVGGDMGQWLLSPALKRVMDHRSECAT